MKSTKTTFDEAPNQNWKPQFVGVPWLNTQPIDYRLTINHP